jgi:CheY-like chemotaxis protein
MTISPVILVVDDDMLLRELVIEIAQQAGFEVLSAATADEAIAVLEAREDVRLVFTDIQMPGSMDGLSLAHAVRNRWPPVELIVTSGRRRIETHELPKRGRFVAKPYDAAALCRTFLEMTGTSPH